MAAGFAKCTLYPSSISAPTIQYQLYVDSTTIPMISSLKGARTSLINRGSLGTFFLNILLPSPSMIPIKLLLPCRSEATYNCLIRHLLGWIGFLTQAYHEIHSLGMLRGAFYMIIRLAMLQFIVRRFLIMPASSGTASNHFLPVFQNASLPSLGS